MIGDTLSVHVTHEYLGSCTAMLAELAILFGTDTAAAAAAARCLLPSMCNYCPHLILRFCLPGSAFLKRSSARQENEGRAHTRARASRRSELQRSRRTRLPSIYAIISFFVPHHSVVKGNTHAIEQKGGEKRLPRILSSQRTLTSVSVTSIGRLLTMILLSAFFGACTAGAAGAAFLALVLF